MDAKLTLAQIDAVVNDPNAMPAEVREAAWRLRRHVERRVTRRATPAAEALKQIAAHDEATVTAFLRMEQADAAK
jgi:hypothetical protein